MNAPACFTSKRIFTLWEKANSSIPDSAKCSAPCADCLPLFQLRMKTRGLCDHPETQFAFEQKAVVGYWPVLKKQEFA